MGRKQEHADISVVIPTYNRPDTLKQTLLSYLHGNTVPREIIVVDQSHNPFDVSYLGDTHSCNVRVIPSSTPSSTRSRNIGAREASSDILLFSDDDVLVDEDSIARLDALMGDSSVALAAGVDLPENGIHGTPSKPSGLRNLVGMFLGMKKPWRTDGYVIKSNMRGRYPACVFSSVPTEWAMGYFFCVRRSCMERWNCWFDESLKRYAYAEDLDFSLRYCSAAQQEGLKTLLVPDIYVNHLGSKEWRTPTDEATRYFIENRRYLSRKIYPKRWWYRIMMFWFDALFAISQIRNREYFLSLMRHLVKEG